MSIKKKIVTIRIEVDNDVQAYQAVSGLAFDYRVVSAGVGDTKEVFDKKNTPFHFLKNNKNNKKNFRDIKKERNK